MRLIGFLCASCISVNYFTIKYEYKFTIADVSNLIKLYFSLSARCLECSKKNSQNKQTQNDDEEEKSWEINTHSTHYKFCALSSWIETSKSPLPNNPYLVRVSLYFSVDFFFSALF